MSKSVPILAIIFIVNHSFAQVAEVDSLMNRLDGQNRELLYSKANLKNQQESQKISESFQYPNFHLTGTASKGKDISLDTTSAAGVNPSQLSQLGVQFPTAANIDGWITSLSANYYLFSRYAITDAIESSKIGIRSAELTIENQKNSKKSQLLQVLLEWKWLQSTINPLEEARALLQKVQSHAQNNAQLLYTETDRTDSSEKMAELEFSYLKATEAIKIAESALHDLIPDLKTEELKKIPDFDVKYETPDEKKIMDIYMEKSQSRKIQDNDVLITQRNFESARKWNKPWVPIALLTSSVYKYGQYNSNTPQDGWSVGLVFDFNLYDSGLTAARTSQANLAYMVAKNKRDDTFSKNQISLSAQLAKAKISLAEYELKKIRIKKKKHQLNDIIDKRKRGLSTNLEITLASLDFAKSQLEAIDAYKSYQSANLGIAVDLNEWEKVKIYETK